MKNVGELESFDPTEVAEAEKVAELSPSVAGSTTGAFTGAFKVNKVFAEFPAEMLDELDRVLARKEMEQEDLLRALTVEADKWGRARIKEIKKETDARIRTSISMEGTDIQAARKRCAKDKKSAKLITKKAMKALQEKLQETLDHFDTDLKEDLVSIRDKYKGVYDRVETESREEVERVGGHVGGIIQALRDMTEEQLRELSQHGTVQVDGVDMALPGVEDENDQQPEGS